LEKPSTHRRSGTRSHRPQVYRVIQVSRTGQVPHVGQVVEADQVWHVPQVLDRADPSATAPAISAPRADAALISNNNSPLAGSTVPWYGTRIPRNRRERGSESRFLPGDHPSGVPAPLPRSFCSPINDMVQNPHCAELRCAGWICSEWPSHHIPSGKIAIAQTH
jgi:hypothetical protein